ncbi:MAG: right-handed parallel beta-helix repeat-containing protein, partial [Prolixibacteraceae bacterium]|nr:right-handed parallel beta-helix repeat-containing protein [Prolixibacteraceae bacterium]
MKWILVLIVSFFSIQGTFAHNFEVSIGDPSYIEPSFFNQEPGGNDTIFINPNRKKGIIFYGFAGTANQPLVIMNGNGLVSINDQEAWSGIQLKNCKHIKLSGAGSKLYRYGLKLAGSYSGVNVTQQSSNIEIEFIEIDHEGFAGIQVKDDYGGNPPFPFPTFKELVIHDCFIQNVSEGMYLGETKSPGLEFSYVKVFNNIIRNTKREGIQLANMTEDVEVYNNYISNSGRDLLSGHGNCIQIGDNTVAAVFNNVLEGAAEFGVIVFGIGHINIYNNYISNTNGIFIDNRIFSDLLAKIEINNNFFRELKLEQVVLNYNEINDLYCSQNIYEGDIPFYHSLCSNCSNNFLSNNTSQTVPSFNTLDLTDGIFIANENNDNNYLEMGPNATINYLFNSWPEFKNLKNVFVNKGEKIIHAVEAEVHDGDLLSFRFKNLPDFVSINEIQNGLIHLEVDATNQQVQIYNAEVTVIEESHK